MGSFPGDVVFEIDSSCHMGSVDDECFIFSPLTKRVYPVFLIEFSEFADGLVTDSFA